MVNVFAKMFKKLFSLANIYTKTNCTAPYVRLLASPGQVPVRSYSRTTRVHRTLLYIMWYPVPHPRHPPERVFSSCAPRGMNCRVFHGCTFSSAYTSTVYLFRYQVKSSQVVGLRDRVAIIRTLIFSSPHPYAGSGEVWLR